MKHCYRNNFDKGNDFFSIEIFYFIAYTIFYFIAYTNISKNLYINSYI